MSTATPELDTYPIFPFYLVIDTSVSMTPALPALNEELPLLKRMIQEDPIVGEIARFGILAFSDSAETILPLADLAGVSAMPRLQPVGATNYAAAFELLRLTLINDIEHYKRYGVRVHRPAVFFISDGEPTPELSTGWQDHYRALIEPTFIYRPNIVAFGFGDANPGVIAHVATFKAYIAREGQTPTNVLRSVAQALSRSILASSRNAGGGQAMFRMERPAGTDEIAVPYV